MTICAFALCGCPAYACSRRNSGEMVDDNCNGTITVFPSRQGLQEYPAAGLRLAEWNQVPFHQRRQPLHWVLQDIDFTVNPAEAVGIIASTARKSTLLKDDHWYHPKPTTGGVHITGVVAAMLAASAWAFPIPISPPSRNAFMAGHASLATGSMESSPSDAEIGPFARNRRLHRQPARLLQRMQNALGLQCPPQAHRPDVFDRRRSAVSGRCLFPTHKVFARIHVSSVSGARPCYLSVTIKSYSRLFCWTSLTNSNSGSVREGEPEKSWITIMPCLLSVEVRPPKFPSRLGR